MLVLTGRVREGRRRVMQGCPTYPQNFLTLNSACGSLRLPWRLAGAVEEWMVGLQARDGGLMGR